MQDKAMPAASFAQAGVKGSLAAGSAHHGTAGKQQGDGEQHEEGRPFVAMKTAFFSIRAARSTVSPMS